MDDNIMLSALCTLPCNLCLVDEIFVINKGGYIGSTARNEIEYARKSGKPVLFLVAPQPSNSDPCKSANYRDF